MIYVSLLRGINVGGHNRIRMADLKAVYAAQGLSDVETYIQSGNVVFAARRQKESTLRAKLAKALKREHEIDVPVTLRTADELAATVANCPFGAIDPVADGTKFHVTFLSSAPTADRIAALQPHVIPPERVVVIGREAYLHCPNGYANTKLSNPLIEKKLAVTATSRNWKTVLKLAELSRRD